ncbi:hypothetical protein [Chitinophaga barathri]|uniref:Protein BatD n=1 Tax=Chitinophaga barathri TaxID=1647451 RepID=A0A3N4MES5_9BACT|nr:hypothetical protein [Chitinophaga barathri]RPD40147.1 hypothetical protein EG028_15950 [Chitinophaga barathri]
MKGIKNILVYTLLAGLFITGRAQAQEQPDTQYNDYFKVTARPDTTSIRIGEPVKIGITARVVIRSLKGANIKVVFPNLPDSLNHIEVVERSPLDTTGSTEDEKYWKQTLTVTSFDSGRWELAPMKFEVFSVSDGSYDSVFTDPIFIDVNTVAVDTTKAFKPIKPLRTVAWNILDYWPYLLPLLLVITLVVLYFAYWRKRKPKAAPAPAKPLKSPYETAMEQLQLLEKEKPWNTDVKLYYTQLTDVLRHYFEQQFHIAALEQTTAELLQNIKPVTVLNQQRDKLQHILTLADLAKFAKLQPAPHEHEDCLNKAIEVVEWTKRTAAAQTEQSLTGTNQ